MGFHAETPKVVTYAGSRLAASARAPEWVIFFTEYAVKVAVHMIWTVYEHYTLWFLPRHLIEDIRALNLDFVMGERDIASEVRALRRTVILGLVTSSLGR